MYLLLVVLYFYESLFLRQAIRVLISFIFSVKIYCRQNLPLIMKKLLILKILLMFSSQNFKKKPKPESVTNK